MLTFFISLFLYFLFFRVSILIFYRYNWQINCVLHSFLVPKIIDYHELFINFDTVHLLYVICLLFIYFIRLLSSTKLANLFWLLFLLYFLLHHKNSKDNSKMIQTSPLTSTILWFQIKLRNGSLWSGASLFVVLLLYQLKIIFLERQVFFHLFFWQFLLTWTWSALHLFCYFLTHIRKRFLDFCPSSAQDQKDKYWRYKTFGSWGYRCWEFKKFFIKGWFYSSFETNKWKSYQKWSEFETRNQRKFQ